MVWVLLPLTVSALSIAASAVEPLHDRLVCGGSSFPPLLITQVHRHATGDMDAAELPDGARIVRVDLRHGESIENMTPDFVSAAWPNLSFDISRFLFVGRRSSSDRPAIWEFNLAHGALRQVTDAFACRRAIYLSQFYTLELERPEPRIAFLARPHDERVDAIFTCRLDGSDIRRIIFSPQGVSNLFQLTDGRLLFSMPCMDVEHLFTVHIDGADLFPFTGIYDPPAFRTMPCETAVGDVLFVESPVGRGALPMDPFEAVARRGTTLATISRARSLRSRRPLVHPEGTYHSPSALPDGHVLVSYRPDDNANYGVYILDPRDGGTPTLVFDDPDRDDLGPVAIAHRAVPAGRSSGIDRKSAMGQFYCLNAYMTGPGESPIPPGSIDRVRIVGAQSPAVLPSADLQVLNEAKVEPDGSFFVEVPAETPLRVETLDENGQVLRAMRTWMWVMPGEERGCIGCHEDREFAPPNRHVMALRKAPHRISTSPQRLGHTMQGEGAP